MITDSLDALANTRVASHDDREAQPKGVTTTSVPVPCSDGETGATRRDNEHGAGMAEAGMDGCAS